MRRIALTPGRGVGAAERALAQLTILDRAHRMLERLEIDQVGPARAGLRGQRGDVGAGQLQPVPLGQKGLGIACGPDVTVAAEQKAARRETDVIGRLRRRAARAGRDVDVRESGANKAKPVVGRAVSADDVGEQPAQAVVADALVLVPVDVRDDPALLQADARVVLPRIEQIGRDVAGHEARPRIDFSFLE